MKISPGALALFCLLLFCTSWQFATAQMSGTSSMSCSSVDIDIDDDNLIDICDIDGFNEISDDGYGTMDQGCLGTCNGYELMNNLDFAGEDREPIAYFNAIFDAHGYTLSNISISKSGEDYVGLFARVQPEAKINNFRLLNVNVVGGDYVGGLVGENEGEITNSCIVNRDENHKIEGQQKVGGLVGDNAGGIIRNSCATGIVEGMTIVGGLVGSNNSTGVIANSSVVGDISESIAISVAGGLAGHNIGRSAVVNSYATGKVTGALAGGLVGRNSAMIGNSYATGVVTGNVSGTSLSSGGLVGQNSADRNNVGGIIKNSYAIGDVAGNLPEEGEDISAAVGGLIGLITGGDITNSYAIGNVSGSFGVDVGSLVGLVSVRERDRGRVAYSYAKNEDQLELVGFDNGGEIIASFTADILSFRSPTGPSSTSTEIYYWWSKDDWDFGTERQRPILKYTKGFNDEMPLCGGSSGLPRCGTPLPQQPANIYTDIRILLEGILR